MSKYRKYNIELIEKIIKEINSGKSKFSISKKYNIPRGTIMYWYKNDIGKQCNIKNKKVDLLNLDKDAYSYILGVYLGDGYINKMERTWKLRFFLDSRQTLVIDECVKNLKKIFIKNKVSILTTKYNYIIIYLYSNYIPNLFPHLGEGEKYKRKIELNEFQINIINYDKLMKGLFHSDGSFYIASGKYPRYQFTNKSIDLINIFKFCMIRNNIIPKYRQRKNGIYDIQIQNKKDVNKLYPILGEKYYNKKFE
jgi:hypothetical protein